MKQARRVVWFILSTVLLCALLGGAYGRQVEATTGSDDSDVKASLNAFTRVYDIVEANYADPVDPDTTIYGPPNGNTGAIPGALRTLDPHSNFFDPRAFALLREDQEGKYYGVGMSIQCPPRQNGQARDRGGFADSRVARLSRRPAPGRHRGESRWQTHRRIEHRRRWPKCSRAPRARRFTSPSFAKDTTSRSKSTSRAMKSPHSSVDDAFLIRPEHRLHPHQQIQRKHQR